MQEVGVNGAFCVKHKGLYYLLYTANHFRSVDYSMGYALSKSPTGPWKKFARNPILKATADIKGPGNGMVVSSPSGGELIFVYHAHCAPEKIAPRKLCIDRCRFVPDPNAGPDRFVIDGPTSTPQLSPK